MSALDQMLATPQSSWVQRRSMTLSGRAKYCAANSFRYLRWANELLEDKPIIAAFCSSHATEEAVAAFVSAAKFNGYRDVAKEINLHNHANKAVVSVFSQILGNSLEKISIGVLEDADVLAYRIDDADEPLFGELRLSSIHTSVDDSYDAKTLHNLGVIPELAHLPAEVKRVTAGRDKLLYATDTGIPTGFLDPATALVRDAKLTFGMIWAAIELSRPGEPHSPLVKAILEEMANLSRQFISKRSKTQKAE